MRLFISAGEASGDMLGARLLSALSRIEPDIEAFDGSSVRFVDGSTAEVDLVVMATGYRMSFPFMNDSYVLAEDGRPNLFLNIFHPRWDDLFLSGLVQANGSMWRVADHQARLDNFFGVQCFECCAFYFHYSNRNEKL